ncbi:MAG: crossover junction endodeoxyribonuclease RuvC [Bacteroidales bacterium]|nr:crossover junction endodeoxyribonuclease RuvC [Bacteroidales bacterium]
MSAKDRIILGIDPGTNIMGFGVVDIKQKQARFVAMDAIKFNKLSDPYLKLQKIFFATIELIEIYKPDELAIEAPFFGKNVQSMLKLGRAQGVAIAAALSRDIPIFEYAPRKIKMAITGQGGASKEQVASILSKTLSFKEIPKDLDATDGLAVALCHFYQDKAIKLEKGVKGWADFIKKNPDRVK